MPFRATAESLSYACLHAAQTLLTVVLGSGEDLDEFS